MDVLLKLKKLMNERDWTEYRLSKNAKVSQSTVKNIFQRNNVPTVATIEKFCDAFGISLSQFFAEGDDMIFLAEQEKELLKHWCKLNDQQKAHFLNLFQSLS